MLSFMARSTIGTSSEGRKPLRFVLVGAWNTLFWYGTFTGLYWATRPFGVHYLVVLFATHWISLTNAYLCHKYLVFRAMGKISLAEYFRFSLVYAFAFVVNLVTLPLLTNFAGLNPVIAQGLIVAGTVAMSFFGHSNFSFAKWSAAPTEPLFPSATERDLIAPSAEPESTTDTEMPAESRRQLSCPICGSTAASDPEVASATRAEEMSFADLKPHWRGFFKEKVFFSYYRCPHCGMLYCRDYFDDTQMDALYGQMPDNTAGVPLEALKRTQAGYFSILRKHSDLRGEYLEIGPDLGLFLEEAVQRGQFGKYWLFEPNETVRPVLQKIVAQKEHEIFTEMLDFKSLPDHLISTVVLIHVLDHLVDPKAVLVALREKLSASAILLIVTHDEASLLAKLIGRKWPPYCLQHPMLFNPTTIKALLRSAGFDVITVAKVYNHFPAMYLVKHLCWALGLERLSSGTRMGPTIPLKLGNIVSVATPSRGVQKAKGPQSA